MGLRADQERDEITEYLDGRYIGSVESCWHIFEFAMHAESPTVYRFPVNLEDQHMVYFNPDDNINDVLERGAVREHLRVPTSLTESLHLMTPSTSCLDNTLYVPPHRR